MPPRTPTRRALLWGASGALALAAGCISDLESESDAGTGTGTGPDSGDGSTDAEPEPDADGTDDETDGEDVSDADDEESTTDGDGDLDYETVRFRYPETSTEPDAAVLRERDDAADWLDERGLEDDAVDAFVAETDFADATLVALEADAPSHCYELVLEEVAFDADGGTAESDVSDGDSPGDDGDETDDDPNDAPSNADGDDAADGTLELEAEVRDEAAENEVCAQAWTTVGVLVRASVDGDPVAELSARIVDDDGTEHGIGVAAASETDSGEEASETDA